MLTVMGLMIEGRVLISVDIMRKYSVLFIVLFIINSISFIEGFCYAQCVVMNIHWN